MIVNIIDDHSFRGCAGAVPIGNIRSLTIEDVDNFGADLPRVNSVGGEQVAQYGAFAANGIVLDKGRIAKVPAPRAHVKSVANARVLNTCRGDALLRIGHISFAIVDIGIATANKRAVDIKSPVSS